MNREEIMTILPHRDNMLLLDDVENKDGVAIGHYTVRGDEFFLKGHFPDNPIVPGVILCEILAQSACVLMQDAMSEGKLPVYTGLNNVKFRSPVKPGDTVETPIWDVYKDIVSKEDSRGADAFCEIERFKFYEEAKKAYCVIATGETALYANIMLQKGVV